jgi:hypothetical protein
MARFFIARDDEFFTLQASRRVSRRDKAQLCMSLYVCVNMYHNQVELRSIRVDTTRLA